MLTAQADQASALENPRLFVYVIGGLSHHEICQAAVLQENLNAQIVLGSNEILTPNEFLKNLENLHKVDINKMKAGDMSEM